jgi:hypothetical protein
MASGDEGGHSKKGGENSCSCENAAFLNLLTEKLSYLSV